MSIQSALRALPSWPVLIICPVVVAVLLVWHYGSAYAECSRLADARTSIRDGIASAYDAKEAFRLDRAAHGFDWDEVRILNGFQPDGNYPTRDCPFGWDIDRETRATLIGQRLYTLLAFAKNKQFVGYLEYRGDWAVFEQTAEVLTRSDAVFSVDKSGSEPALYILRQVTGGS